MDLMLKDVTICADTIDELGMDFPVMKQVHEQFKKAERELGPKSEHMELLKMYEKNCGVEISRAPTASLKTEVAEVAEKAGPIVSASMSTADCPFREAEKERSAELETGNRLLQGQAME